LTLSVTPCREGVLLSVRVTAKARRDEVAGIRRMSDGREALSTRVRAAPEQGKANKAVVATVAKFLGLPKSSVCIRSGETGRGKILLIAGEPEQLEAMLRLRLKTLPKETK
jgi:uncharacterized protein (TIGR00251 family)